MNTVKSSNIDSPSNKSDITQPGSSHASLGLVAYGDDEEEEEQVETAQTDPHSSPPFSISTGPSGLETTLAASSSLPIAGPVAALRVIL